MALQTFSSGFTLNQFDENQQFNSESGSNIQVWGEAALVQNKSTVVAYITTVQNSSFSVDHCIELRPGERILVPLTGKTSGTGDFISGAAFTNQNDNYIFVTGVQYTA